MRKQPIFIDIDGCLTPGKNQAIPWQQVEALQKSLKKMSNFYEYIIVTARPATYAEAVVQFLGLMDSKKHRHAVCESGGVCHLFGSDTYSVSSDVDHDLLNKFEGTLRRLQPVYKYNIEDGRKRTINLLPATGETPRGLAILMREYLPEGLEMHNSAGGIDITPAKIDKAVACRDLADKLGFDIVKAIAIGDSGGDLPILKIVDNPACPANAFENIKDLVRDRGGYIAKKEHGFGVVEILEHYADKSKVH